MGGQCKRGFSINLSEVDSWICDNFVHPSCDVQNVEIPAILRTCGAQFATNLRDAPLANAPFFQNFWNLSNQEPLPLLLMGCFPGDFQEENGCCWLLAVGWLLLSWLLSTDCCWLIVSQLASADWLLSRWLLLTDCCWLTAVDWLLSSCLLLNHCCQGGCCWLTVVDWLLLIDCCQAGCCWLIAVKLAAVDWLLLTDCCQVDVSELPVVNYCLWFAFCQLLSLNWLLVNWRLWGVVVSELLLSIVVSELLLSIVVTEQLLSIVVSEQLLSIVVSELLSSTVVSELLSSIVVSELLSIIVSELSLLRLQRPSCHWTLSCQGCRRCRCVPFRWGCQNWHWSFSRWGCQCWHCVSRSWCSYHSCRGCPWSWFFIDVIDELLVLNRCSCWIAFLDVDSNHLMSLTSVDGLVVLDLNRCVLSLHLP